VEEGDERPSRQPQGGVPRRRRTRVLRKRTGAEGNPNIGERRTRAFDHRASAVFAPVVDHDSLDRPVVLRGNARQRALKQRGPVVGRNHDGDERRINQRSRPSKPRSSSRTPDPDREMLKNRRENWQLGQVIIPPDRSSMKRSTLRLTVCVSPQ
jgi:hypothetical protein